MPNDDIQAFIDTDYERVVRVVALVCGDRQRAEDAVQEAVVDVWLKGRDVDDLTGWVTRAALNRARSRWRRSDAERRAVERLARRVERSAASPDEPSDLDERVAAVLGRLPRQQREAVALHYLADLSVAEVARRLGIAEGTAKVHLHRARHALRRALAGPDGADGPRAASGDEQQGREADRVRPR